MESIQNSPENPDDLKWDGALATTQARPSKPADESARQHVQKRFEQYQAEIERGISYEEIVADLAQQGVSIEVSTFAKYFCQERNARKGSNPSSLPQLKLNRRRR